MASEAAGRDPGTTTGLPPGVDPSLLPADEVARLVGTDLEQGLSEDEASRRLVEHGPNVLDSAPPVPAWRRILAQLHNPLVYLLLGAVAVSLVAWLVEGRQGAPLDALVIAAIVLANAVLGFVQEARAADAVASLQAMSAATAVVVRGGRVQRVPARDLVRGDVLLLAEGDAVAADARLATAAGLTVAEASLTGESEPVAKRPAALAEPAALGDRTGMVFAGTAVTRGTGRAVVVATAMETQNGRIAQMLARTEAEPTPLQAEVARVGKMLGVAVIVIAVVVVGAVLLVSDVRGLSDVVAVLLLGVSLAVAAVPEGLPAVLSVVLALGVQRMAAHRAIVKNPSSVETLGSASVICSDKTGTLTRNEMTVQRVVTASGQVRLDGVGYAPVGAVTVAPPAQPTSPTPPTSPARPRARDWSESVVTDSRSRPISAGVGGTAGVEGGEALRRGEVLRRGEALWWEVAAVLGGGSLANDARLRRVEDGWRADGDPTEIAFLVAERKLGITDRRTRRFRRVGEVPFDSDRKLMTAVERDAERADGVVVVTKGAPDVLLDRCGHVLVGRDVVPMDEARRSAALDAVRELSDDALRTLGVAYREVGPDAAASLAGAEDLADRPDDVEQDLVWAGVVGIIDPPRSTARDAVAAAHRAGIRVMMITGDHPRTAARIATDLGIAEPGDPTLTGPELDAMDDAERLAAIRVAPVLARVAPEHKLAVVDALQADGEVVAMTGDGVNDAPALKSADIGVAMGVTGTQVTRDAAAMILADDNFATIVEAVREGRGIFANIKKFLRYLLSSNMGEVLTIFLGVIGAGVLGLSGHGEAVVVPLLAVQILWINLLTDTAPALAMGVDPQTDDVMARPPRRLSDRVIDRRMWSGVLQIGLVMALVTLAAIDLYLPGGFWEGDQDLTTARTAGFTVLVLAQLFNAFNSRSETTSVFHGLLANRWLFGAIGLSLALQVAVVHVPFLQRAFGTASLGLDQWLVCTALASAVLWYDELRKIALRALSRRALRAQDVSVGRHTGVR